MRLDEQISAALACGAREGSSVAARAALQALDPLLRVVARRRLERLLARARRETIHDDPSHLLRVAALLALTPEPASSLDDTAAVQAELEALGERKLEKQRPWWTLSAVAALNICGAVVFLLMAWLAPFDARATPVGRVLGDELTAFVAALDARSDRASALEGARARLTGAQARRALGDDGVARLAPLLEATEKLTRAGPDAGGVAEIEAFLGTASSFVKFLHERRLPFFLDADVLRGDDGVRPILMSSYVEREVELESGGRRIRALHLWRLDRLNVRFGALGYTRPRTPAALVLLDQVETDLVRWVLPALPAGESAELVDEETALRPEPWITDVEREAAGVLRRHYKGPSNDPAFERVKSLLSRRRALVKKWRASLSSQRLTLVIPERLIPERNYAKELEIRITRANLREWDELHRQLLAPEMLAAFARLRDRYTLSIERHEAQHRLDLARGFRPLPELVARLLNVENPLDVREGGLAASTRDEFSAYLAQLADCPDGPLQDLVLMTRLALSKHTLGGPHSLAAIACLLAVGAELGLDSGAYVDRGISRRHVAELFSKVTVNEPARIQAAARAVYAKTFGEPLARIERRTVHDNQPWRH